MTSPMIEQGLPLWQAGERSQLRHGRIADPCLCQRARKLSARL
jgi:hypothetical protein